MPERRTKPSRSLWFLVARKRAERRFLVLKHFEHGIELGDLQEAVDLLRQVQEFKFSRLPARRNKRADQLPETGAVDVGHGLQVEQDLFLPFGDQGANLLPQQDRVFAEYQAPIHIENSHAILLPRVDFHSHAAIISSIRKISACQAAAQET